MREEETVRHRSIRSRSGAVQGGVGVRVRASDLRAKDVVNVSDGRKLGYLYDLDIDVESGRIRSLVLPAGGRPGWFRGRDRDIEVAWHDIVKVGIDVILVDLPGSVSPRLGAEPPSQGL